MNTTRKGSDYENDYRRALIARGYHVSRGAASHGSDLTAIGNGRCVHISCKNDGRGCVSAENESRKWKAFVLGLAGRPCEALFVHPTKEERFCEH